MIGLETLEYAYNDWCLMTMGSTLYNMRSLGKDKPGPGDAEYLKACMPTSNAINDVRGISRTYLTRNRFFRRNVTAVSSNRCAPQEVTSFPRGNSWQYSSSFRMM